MGTGDREPLTAVDRTPKEGDRLFDTGKGTKGVRRIVLMVRTTNTLKRYIRFADYVVWEKDWNRLLYARRRDMGSVTKRKVG